MNIIKPDWNPLQLNDNYLRLTHLENQTVSHYDDCACNLCMEKFGLDALTNCFTQDEHAGAIIADNERIRTVLAEMERQMDDTDLEFNFADNFEKERFRLKSARQIINAYGKNPENLADEVKFWIEETSENTDFFVALSPLRPDKRGNK